MIRFTVSISEGLKDKIDKMPEINWTEIVKKGILDKIDQLERFENFEKNGKRNNFNR